MPFVTPEAILRRPAGGFRHHRFQEERVICNEEDIVLLAVGSMVKTAEEVRHGLRERGFSCTLVNARFAKPIDKDLIRRAAKDPGSFVTMGRKCKCGGFGEHVNGCQMRSEARLLFRTFWMNTECGGLKEGRETNISASIILKKVMAAALGQNRAMSAGRKIMKERLRMCCCGAAGLHYIEREGESHHHGRSGLCGRPEGTGQEACLGKRQRSRSGKYTEICEPGGLKLEKAMSHFAVTLGGKVCMDVGASTSGSLTACSRTEL